MAHNINFNEEQENTASLQYNKKHGTVWGKL